MKLLEGRSLSFLSQESCQRILLTSATFSGRNQNFPLGWGGRGGRVKEREERGWGGGEPYDLTVLICENKFLEEMSGDAPGVRGFVLDTTIA